MRRIRIRASIARGSKVERDGSDVRVRVRVGVVLIVSDVSSERRGGGAGERGKRGNDGARGGDDRGVTGGGRGESVEINVVGGQFEGFAASNVLKLSLVLCEGDFSVETISGEIVDEGGAVNDGGVGRSDVEGLQVERLSSVHLHNLLKAFVVGGKVEFLQNVVVAREVIATNVGEEEVGKEGEDGDEEEAPDGDGIGPDKVKDVNDFREEGGHGGEDPEKEEEEDEGAPHAQMNEPDPPLSEEGNLEDDGEETTDEGRHA